jgi:hypothetical protein
MRPSPSSIKRRQIIHAYFVSKPSSWMMPRYQFLSDEEESMEHTRDAFVKEFMEFCTGSV